MAIRIAYPDIRGYLNKRSAKSSRNWIGARSVPRISGNTHKVRCTKRRNKCPPVIEDDQQNAEDKSVICSKKLAVRPVRVLFVVTIECAPILKSVVIGCHFDPVIECNI